MHVRKRLELAQSLDGGRTWAPAALLDDGAAWQSDYYPAIATGENVVLVACDSFLAYWFSLNFEALGFRVEQGGRNGPVHNALIYLSDGNYIELTCPVSKVTRGLFRILHWLGLLALVERARPGLMHRFYAWFGGPVGLQDWCVRVPDLDGCRQDALTGGVRMAETRPFRRTRPDGAVAEWRLVAPTRRAEPFWRAGAVGDGAAPTGAGEAKARRRPRNAKAGGPYSRRAPS